MHRSQPAFGQVNKRNRSIPFYELQWTFERFPTAAINLSELSSFRRSVQWNARLFPISRGTRKREVGRLHGVEQLCGPEDT